MRLRKRLLIFIAILQSVLFLAHFLWYETWTFSATSGHVAGPLWIRLLLGILSLTFVPASLLAFRYTNAVVRLFYRIAAVWVGLLSFLFIAMLCCWVIFGLSRIAGFDVHFHTLGEVLFGAALIVGLAEFSTQTGRASRGPQCGWQICRKPGGGEERRLSATCT
ncbi:MAG TPA: hypothetical protein VGU90_15435 [Terriglobales bacterium]|nr:hypothetical protein [Terriglobales bacterium]